MGLRALGKNGQRCTIRAVLLFGVAVLWATTFQQDMPKLRRVDAFSTHLLGIGTGPQTRRRGWPWQQRISSTRLPEEQREVKSQAIDDNDSDDETSSATLRSVTFLNLPKDQEPELLSDFLMEVGACSVSMTDADAGTDREAPLFAEPSSSANSYWRDSLQWAAPVWNQCHLTAHFPASVDLDFVLNMVQETFPNQFPTLDHDYQVEQVPNRDWVVHVQSGWKPIVVGRRFLLRFPWHTEDDVQQAIVAAETTSLEENDDHDNGDDGKPHGTKASNNMVQLELQGGIAFGTGEHATTQLCLKWLDRELTGRLLLENDATTNDENDDDTHTLRILDYGAGSGILGIAACKLAQQRAIASHSNNHLAKAVVAVGVDIDVDACRIANANAATNQVPMRTYLPTWTETMDDESKSLWLKARALAAQLSSAGGNNNDDNDSVVLEDEEANEIAQMANELFWPSRPNETTTTGSGTSPVLYDVCVANILAGPLVALAPTLADLVKKGGVLGMSGILPPQGNEIVEAYTAAGFENVQVEQELGGWILVSGRKKKQ